MLSRFRREIAAVELYGKLPIAKDYLRVGGGEESGLALRDWLDRGFSPTSDAEHRPLLAWPGRFVLAPSAAIRSPSCRRSRRSPSTMTRAPSRPCSAT